MRPILIELKTAQPPITIAYRNLSDPELTTKRREMRTTVFATRLNAFDQYPTRLEYWRFTHSVRTIAIEVQIHRNFEYAQEIKRNMQLIIERLLFRNMLGFLTTSLEQQLTLYLDGYRPGGAAYVVCDDTRTDCRIKIFLPSNIMKRTDILACQLIAQGAHGESQWDRMIRGYILHEMGHVFHQIMMPSYYHGCSDCIDCRGGMIPALQPFFSHVPTKNQLERFTYANGLSVYSHEMSVYGCTNPLEFVAETFSGILMGLPFSDALIDQYRALGGPDIMHYAGMLAHHD